MSDNANFGFGKLVPGFDFLQNLAKGAAQNLPSLQNWIAPTMNVEELDKRISELKAVQFWLDQNGKALGATIQALEVQKMTLATLKGMNFSMGEVADALKMKPMADQPAAKPAAAEAPAAAKKPAAKKAGTADAGGAAAAGMVDPMQWWGALTQQFQQIASSAMSDVAQSAGDAVTSMAAAKPKAAGKKSAAAKKSAPRKSRG
ncbi:MAG: PhaM family polyhydroxyalkanoate granule multifunctional regulatory protein [Pseudomonadota bacterium]